MKNSNYKTMDVFALFLPEIKELIKNKDFNAVKDMLKIVHSMDIAEGMRNLEPNEIILVFRLLGTKKAVEVFEYLNFQEQNYILNNLENEEVSQIFNEMAPDERADLFKELPAKVFKKLLQLVDKEGVQNLNNLMTFKEGTAGSLMTTEFIEIKKDISARQAILDLQENLRAEFRENIYSVYVTDKDNKLVGIIPLQDLLKAPPDIQVKDIMLTVAPIKIAPESDAKEVANLFTRYALLDAPVVNKEEVLIGIITVDDIVEMIEKETTKDIYEIGKMNARGGEIISYARATTWELVRRRAGWLVLLLIFDFLTGTVLKNFEHFLSSVVALAFFIPMLLDTGGNAGAQTSITIIRGLATGDVNLKNVLRVIKLELSAAILMGFIVGGVAFARALLLQKDFAIALVVGMTMFLIALLAIATGIILPLFSKKFGLDPAVLAGPITTSIVDVIGLIIYFKVAQIFIPALKF